LAFTFSPSPPPLGLGGVGVGGPPASTGVCVSAAVGGDVALPITFLAFGLGLSMWVSEGLSTGDGDGDDGGGGESVVGFVAIGFFPGGGLAFAGLSDDVSLDWVVVGVCVSLSNDDDDDDDVSRGLGGFLPAGRLDDGLSVVVCSVSGGGGGA
jgi:hypothetical protein